MKLTTDHNEIKKWVRKHKGRPEIINNVGSHEHNVGLRIDFPGMTDDLYLSEDNPPEDTTWEKFFTLFEEENLAFEYDDRDSITDPSSAFHFLRRDIAASEEENE